MKALTLWQPWASFMLGPGRPKRNETRPWRTSYRGVLAIHAAKREPGWVREAFCEPGPLRALLLNHLRENAAGHYNVDDVFGSLPRGEVLGRVELWGCVKVHDEMTLSDAEYRLGDYSDGRFVWLTHYAHRLVTPIPHRGRQGLWNLPDDVLEPLAWEAPR